MEPILAIRQRSKVPPVNVKVTVMESLGVNEPLPVHGTMCAQQMPSIEIDYSCRYALVHVFSIYICDAISALGDCVLAD